MTLYEIRDTWTNDKRPDTVHLVTFVNDDHESMKCFYAWQEHAEWWFERLSWGSLKIEIRLNNNIRTRERCIFLVIGVRIGISHFPGCDNAFEKWFPEIAHGNCKDLNEGMHHTTELDLNKQKSSLKEITTIVIRELVFVWHAAREDHTYVKCLRWLKTGSLKFEK